MVFLPDKPIEALTEDELRLLAACLKAAGQGGDLHRARRNIWLAKEQPPRRGAVTYRVIALAYLDEALAAAREIEDELKRAFPSSRRT